MKLDFTKPLQTVNGKEVNIITAAGRGLSGQIPTPVMGYIGNSPNLTSWTKGGRHYSHTDDRALDLIQTNLRYANIYMDGSVGLYPTAEAALLTTKPQLARVKLEFSNGQFDF